MAPTLNIFSIYNAWAGIWVPMEWAAVSKKNFILVLDHTEPSKGFIIG